LPCFSIIKGYAKQDYRVALGVSRVGEAVFTGIDYYFSADSMEIIPYIVPSVLLGIPLGSYLIRWMDPETFRRICMAFDALVVAFGLSRVLIELNLATAFTTYSILTIMMMLNAYLLFRFIRDRTVP
jgi:uncharacterized membrane protein YfcA